MIYILLKLNNIFFKLIIFVCLNDFRFDFKKFLEKLNLKMVRKINFIFNPLKENKY